MSRVRTIFPGFVRTISSRYLYCFKCFWGFGTFFTLMFLSHKNWILSRNRNVVILEMFSEWHFGPEMRLVYPTYFFVRTTSTRNFHSCKWFCGVRIMFIHSDDLNRWNLDFSEQWCNGIFRQFYTVTNRWDQFCDYEHNHIW